MLELASRLLHKVNELRGTVDQPIKELSPVGLFLRKKWLLLERWLDICRCFSGIRVDLGI